MCILPAALSITIQPPITPFTFVSVRKSISTIPRIVSYTISILEISVVTETSEVINVPKTICVSISVSISDVMIVSHRLLLSYNTIVSIFICLPP